MRGLGQGGRARVVSGESEDGTISLITLCTCSDILQRGLEREAAGKRRMERDREREGEGGRDRERIMLHFQPLVHSGNTHHPWREGQP